MLARDLWERTALGIHTQDIQTHKHTRRTELSRADSRTLIHLTPDRCYTKNQSLHNCRREPQERGWGGRRFPYTLFIDIATETFAPPDSSSIVQAKPFVFLTRSRTPCATLQPHRDVASVASFPHLNFHALRLHHLLYLRQHRDLSHSFWNPPQSNPKRQRSCKNVLSTACMPRAVFALLCVERSRALPLSSGSLVAWSDVFLPLEPRTWPRPACSTKAPRGKP